MLVVDASVVASAVAFDGSLATASRRIIVEHDVAAPDLMRVETLSVLRRRSLSGHLPVVAAELALADLLALNVEVYDSALLLGRCWELRSNYSTYDACYIALAETLQCPLATADKRLVNAPGSQCEFVLVEP